MAKNKTLIDELGNLDKLKSKKADARNKALDALLQVNPANAAAFKQAILSEKAFWNDLIPNFTKEPNFLEPKGPPNFLQIQQLVAEQRSKLSLDNLNADQLKDIFDSDYEVSRGHLARLNPQLTTSPLWVNNEDVLPDASLKKIREQAALLFLQHTISTSNDLKLLSDFLTNTADPTTATALGIPFKGQSFLGKPLPATIEEQLKALVTELTAVDFKTHVETNPLANPKADNVDVFLDAYPYKAHLTKSKALEIMGTHYVNPHLKTKSPSDLLAKLKVTDEALVNQLSTENANLAHFAANMPKGALRETVFKEYINKFPVDDKTDLLIKLSNQDNLTGFKTVLAESGIRGESFTRDNMLAIQKEARQRVLLLETKGRSPLLEAAFGRLPQDKQKELLANPDKLNVLRDLHTLRDVKTHLLGAIDEAQATAILQENTNLKRFNTIHNPVVARILANFRPHIQLDPAKVDVINQQFVNAAHAPLALSANNTYRDFINHLIPACGIQAADEGAFREAFGVKPDGSIQVGIKNEIAKDHAKNRDLFNGYYDPNCSETNKQLISLFLNVEKLDALTANDLEEILSTFDSSRGINEFLDKLINNPELQQDPNNPNTPLKFNINQLKQSADALRELKKIDRGQKLQSHEPGEAEQAGREIRQLLKEQRAKQAFIDKSPKRVPDAGNAFHAFVDYFQTRPKYGLKMEFNYKQMATQCDVYLDILHRQLQVLNDHLDPRKQYLPSLANATIPHDIRELTFEMEAQKKEVQRLILEYDVLKEQLKNINEAISLAKQKGYFYVVKPKGFFISVQEAGEVYLPTFPKTTANYEMPKTSVTLSVDDEGEPDELAKRLAKDLIPGQTRTYALGEGHNERFTESVALRRDGSKKRTFTMEDFPAENKADNNKGRMEYAMAMAHAILASRKDCPTDKKPIKLKGENPEEIKYLWTALMILGKTHKDMKFGAKSIDVSATKFDPTASEGGLQENGPVWGFNQNSLYARVFASRTSVMEEEFNKTMNIKFGRNEINASNKAVSEEFKDEFKGLLKSGERTIKERGSAIPDEPLPVPGAKGH